MSEASDRRGLSLAFLTYGIWGIFPLLMDQLRPAGSWEVVAHRALWSLAFTAVVVVATGRMRRLWAALREPRVFGTLALAGLLIGSNWLVMLYAVMSDHVGDSSFGYYINPLMTVALGVLVLRERLRRAQGVAIAVATIAVVVLGVELGGLPWIALYLAVTFALYSLVKKRVASRVDAITGFAVETLVLVPLAVVILTVLSRRGQTTWGEVGLGHDLWLASTGIWTAGALILFAASAARVPLTVLGMVQYLTPTLTFILAITYFGEDMTAARWAGFGLIWAALAIVTVDSWRHSRSRVPATRIP